ncbi:MAG: response regulator [Candidatus Saganbacteria bacterium]|nr:response regulator [Candidatus Saganbacteria bacterium]
MLNKKKILVVDDEKDVVQLLSFRLEKEGFEVISAYNGSDGLAKAQNEKPDLILLDIMLPIMSGYEVCRLLKFNSATQDIPIILLSAKAGDEDKAVGKEVGADMYISKPFEPDILLQKIKELLKL